MRLFRTWIQGFHRSLLPKVLAALLVALVVSSAITAAFETRLTRAELGFQARELLDTDLQILRRAYVDRQSVLVTGLRNAAQTLTLLGLQEPGQRVELVRHMSNVRRSLQLHLLAAVDEDGRPVIALGAPVPDMSADLLRIDAPSQILRTTDGQYAQAAVVPFGSPPARLYLVGGELFDDASAYRMRALINHDVLLVADGRLIGSTVALPGEQPPLIEDGALPERAGVVPVGGADSLLHYVPVAQGADGTVIAAIGVLVPEPLAVLDQTLARTRLLGIAVLAAVAFGLGWVLFRWLTRPLLELAETASRIAEGDADATFDVRSRDEIGVLGQAIERMHDALLDQLAVIQVQAEELQERAKRIVSAQDEERRRIARDLHDGIQQQLVMLRLQVAVARKVVARQPEQGDVVIERIAPEIDRVLERLRETSQNLYPSILQDRGLEGAIYSVAGKSPVSIVVDIEPTPLPRLHRELEANAYFLISEAVSNALKHADPATINVHVELGSQALEIEVTDDGRGFEPLVLTRSGGLGHLRDRATALGGTLEITSSPGTGSSVRAVLPADVRLAGGPLEEEQDSGDAAVELETLA